MKRSHRDLKVWQNAMALVEAIYRTTAAFPASEQYGLSAQMRRAAVSVPSNIAEGFARSGSRELLHFLSLASGSLSELDTQVELATRLKSLAPDNPLPEQIDETSGLLMGLVASVRRRAT